MVYMIISHRYSGHVRSHKHRKTLRSSELMQFQDHLIDGASVPARCVVARDHKNSVVSRRECAN